MYDQGDQDDKEIMDEQNKAARLREELPDEDDTASAAAALPSEEAQPLSGNYVFCQ